MGMLYFQVPDLDPHSDGLPSPVLSLRGAHVASDYARLCRLLELPPAAGANPAYPDACAALAAWQHQHGLMSDGVVGPLCWALLACQRPRSASRRDWLARLSPERLCALFPFTTRKNLQIHAPYVLAALDAAGYGPGSRQGCTMCALALAVIRAQAEGFEPLAEEPSRCNTAAGAAAFSRYEAGTETGLKLGNTQPGDGERFKGRGFLPLTGRTAYGTAGRAIGLPLERLPFLAKAPEVAAVLLVQRLQQHEAQIADAWDRGDEAAAFACVAGQSHGLERFRDCLALWRSRIAPGLQQRREQRQASIPVAQRLGSGGFVLPVRRDRADLRDLPYSPPLRSLPPVWPPAAELKCFVAAERQWVLNQGPEGACTGFALAGVVNMLRWRACTSDAQRRRLRSVSPRMIYELARRYDEFEGSDYQGSSCRGALKGWHKHGVCLASDWDFARDLVPSNPDWATRALQHTLGVYYRLNPSRLVDLQAAIAEVGAILVSAHVHAGWDLAPATGHRNGKLRDHDGLVQIPYAHGQHPRQGSHAFALVGYDTQGFIVHNSWGAAWGSNGFAVLRYEDWLANGMDAWVAALGVPGVVNNTAVPSQEAQARPGAGRARAGAAGSPAMAPPQDLAARHCLVMERGLLARASTRDLLQPLGLGELALQWPQTWFERCQLERPGEPARLVVYALAGLRNERQALERARSLARPLLDNGCYPLFLVSKTGFLEALDAVAALIPSQPDGAGGDPWWESQMHERGSAVWRQVKRDALAAHNAAGALTHLVNSVQVLRATVPDLEVHLIGHSTGSLALAPLIPALRKRRVPLASAHLYAPLCSVAFANRNWLPWLGPRNAQKNTFPLYLSVLGDALERHERLSDCLPGYEKSLPYLVARSLEDAAPTPLFGMEAAWERSKLPGEGELSSACLQALGDLGRAVAELSPAGLHCDVPLTSPFTCTRTDSLGQPLGVGLVRSHESLDRDALLLLRSIERIRRSAPLQCAVDLSAGA